MAGVIDQCITERFALYHGDCCEVMAGIKDNSVHFEIYSPPFDSLYTYSNSDRDLGNCRSREEFMEHMSFVAAHLYRILMPGRVMSVHCMDIPAMKERDGYIGLTDFPGQLIRMFQDAGFIYHSRVAIWKDPLVEATRTKALGLMHKQLQKDSTMCRNGLPDYLVSFRKPGDNPEPVAHPDGLTTFAGEDEPDGPVYSHQVWRRYASPVWMDINQSRTLNREAAREQKDERHICPLQLDVIERAITLYTNPGDTVFTPFLGIGSEAYQALTMARRAVGIELKGSYFAQAVKNCRSAVASEQLGLDDLMEGI